MVGGGRAGRNIHPLLSRAIYSRYCSVPPINRLRPSDTGYGRLINTSKYLIFDINRKNAPCAPDLEYLWHGFTKTPTALF